MNYYLTDGSLIGFYTAAFDAYPDKDAILSRNQELQLSFSDTYRTVPPDEEKANRVCRTLSAYDKRSLGEFDRLLRSYSADREQIAFRYLKMICQAKGPVRGRLSHPYVLDVVNYIGKIGRELDHLHGFLRFTENSAGVLYAPFEPDNNIIDLLMPHFIARLKTFSFILHDKKRNLAAIYNTKQWILVQLSEDAAFEPSQDEAEIQDLWRCYYDSVGISERKNTKLMKRCMPVRYWKYLPEKH